MRRRDLTRGLPWLAGFRADTLDYVPEDLPFKPWSMVGDLEYLVHDLRLYVQIELDAHSYHVRTYSVSREGGRGLPAAGAHHCGNSLAVTLQGAALFWLAVYRHPEWVEYSKIEVARAVIS